MDVDSSRRARYPDSPGAFEIDFLTMTAWANMMPSHATSYLGSKQFFRSMYGVGMYARRCRRPLSCPTEQGIPTNGCSCALPRITAIQAAWFPFPNEVIIWYGITSYYTVAVMALYLVCLDPWQGWADTITTYSTAEPAFRIPVSFLGIRVLEQLILAYSIESVTVTIFAGISSTLYSVLCSRSTNLQPYAWRRGIPERSPMSPFQFPLPVPLPVPTPTAQVLQYNTQGWRRIAVIIHCNCTQAARLQGGGQPCTATIGKHHPHPSSRPARDQVKRVLYDLSCSCCCFLQQKKKKNTDSGAYCAYYFLSPSSSSGWVHVDSTDNNLEIPLASIPYCLIVISRPSCPGLVSWLPFFFFFPLFLC